MTVLGSSAVWCDAYQPPPAATHAASSGVDSRPSTALLRTGVHHSRVTDRNAVDTPPPLLVVVAHAPMRVPTEACNGFAVVVSEGLDECHGVAMCRVQQLVPLVQQVVVGQGFRMCQRL